MKQHIKQFDDFQKNLDDKLNDYLKEHPNYSIHSITYLHMESYKWDNILVVFNVEEELTNEVLI